MKKIKLILFICMFMFFSYSVTALTHIIQSSSIIKDSYMSETFPSSNYGTSSTLFVNGDIGDADVLIYMFNFTGVSSDWEISRVVLNLTLYTNLIDAGETTDVRVMQVFDTFIWNETLINWTTRPILSSEVNYSVESTVQFTDTGEFNCLSCHYTWNITNMFTSQLSQGKSNLTLILNGTDGGIEDVDNLQFLSRESGEGLASQIVVFYTLSNTAPTVTTPVITPSTSYTDSRLNCSFIITDPDVGDTLTANISWFNGSTVQVFTFSPTVTNGTSYSTYLESPNTTKGDTWNCSVTPWDGTALGTTESATKSITNSIPSFSTVPTITPSTSYSDSRLNCTFIVTDLDTTDTLKVNISWFNSSILAIVNSLNTVILDTSYSVYLEAGNTTKGDTWNCSVTPWDGNDLGTTESATKSITSMISVTALDGLLSNLSKADAINTSYLGPIEYFQLNFSLSASNNIFNYYLNFTANGTRGCSLGNKQSTHCYNYSNTNYKWIQFFNGTETATFDSLQGNQGDKITLFQWGTGSSFDIAFQIDEHYNPNVYKNYNASYNFSDVKWQDGKNQRITKNNMLMLYGSTDNLPLDADNYKVDLRVNYSSIAPTQPLEVYLCNLTYSSGDPALTSNCALIAQKLPNELQDDGTKFRGLFTKNLIDTLGNMKCVILKTNIQNPNRYYAIKTYKSTAGSYTTKWNYSTDNGATWLNLGDGYESEINLNWFYNGVEPTSFIYSLWVNTTTGVSEELVGNITWEINPSQNYKPIVTMATPLDNSTISFPLNISWSVVDSNDDALNVSIFLFKSGNHNKTLISSLNENNKSFSWNDTTSSGWYTLFIQAQETSTTQLLSGNSSVSIYVNTIPLFNTVDLISTDLNKTSGNLNISYDYTDDDTDTITPEIRWFKNGLENNTFANMTLIESGNLSETDIWKASVRLNDGYYLTNWLNTSNLTIIQDYPLIWWDTTNNTEVKVGNWQTFSFYINDSSSLGNCTMYYEDPNTHTHVATNTTLVKGLNTMSLNFETLGGFFINLNCSDSYHYSNWTRITAIGVQSLTSAGGGGGGGTSPDVWGNQPSVGETAEGRQGYVLLSKQSESLNNVKLNSVFLIKILEEDHFIIVKNINITDSSVLLEIHSDPFTEIIYEGQELFFDLNNNNKTDMIVSLDKVRETEIDLTISNYETKQKISLSYLTTKNKAIFFILIIILIVYIYLYKNKKTIRKSHKKL